jgi:hypothetical protein
MHQKGSSSSPSLHSSSREADSTFPSLGKEGPRSWGFVRTQSDRLSFPKQFRTIGGPYLRFPIFLNPPVLLPPGLPSSARFAFDAPARPARFPSPDLSFLSSHLTCWVSTTRRTPRRNHIDSTFTDQITSRHSRVLTDSHHTRISRFGTSVLHLHHVLQLRRWLRRRLRRRRWWLRRRLQSASPKTSSRP